MQTPAADARIERLSAADATRLSAEARKGVAVEMAPGLDLSLWAPNALISDPVSISIDDTGTAYVTSSSRAGFVLDIRGHADWVPDVHTLRTNDDLQQFFHRYMAPDRSASNSWIPDLNGDKSHDWRDFSELKERVVRLRDTDNDGIADTSELVFEGFNDDPIYDVATGILVHGDDVFVTVAPGLFRLGGARRGGPLQPPVAISRGYSVHPAFFGHGMSGGVMGPDGRLYWEVGDIGYHVVDRDGRRSALHNQGAVFRANPDGSDFEVFATGIRNLQDFAFDDFGNLISVDNDGDHPGETERLVYITEGSDAGWRSNWQYGKYTDTANNTYNVWMDERMYTPRFDGQAAHITPIIAPWHAGPSGVVFNPGTALGPEWTNQFLISSFPGGAANARIYALELAPDGAGFRVERERVALQGILTPGMRFGPDGALYLTDWITGWESKKDGRIWKLDSPADAKSAARLDVAQRLAQDIAAVGVADLRTWLRHEDMRVRQKAQFELVARRQRAVLEAEAADRTHRYARLHAIWGLGQLMRVDASAAAPVRMLLRDADVEVRAQAAKVLGDARDTASADALVTLLGSVGQPRVTFFAAQALGRIAHPGAHGPIVAMLHANNDRDLFLRHAGVLALSRIGNAEALASLQTHPSQSVRIAAVVALRRMASSDVSRFLADADETVVIEAARAINDDGGIAGAIPALAQLLGTTRSANESLNRRAISANLRSHTAADLQRLTAFARDRQRPETMRVEAINTIAVWPAPSRFDRVDGYQLAQPASAVASQDAPSSILELIGGISNTATPAEKVALAHAAGRLGVQKAAPVLMAQLRGDAAPEVRMASMHALQTLGVPNIDEVMRIAVADADAAVRRSALRILPDLALAEPVKVRHLVDVIGTTVVPDQQVALEVLGAMKSAEATGALASITNALTSGTVAPAIQLDVVDALQTNGAATLTAQLDAFLTTRKAGSLLAAFPDGLLNGGDAARGAVQFTSNAAAGCTRCHLIGTTGSDVGPRLTTIGATLTKAQILEALIDPSARIAPGFGTPPSAMPPVGALLRPRDIRDLVEYLSSLKQAGVPGAPAGH